MEKKTFNTEIEFKENADQTGQFVAVFSRFNEIDKHNDVTEPGAFEDGAKVKIASWGHDWNALPVGRGVIHQDGEKAWVDGQFFLNTEGGRETYQTVKALEELQEWSYGFEVLESSEGTFDEKKVRMLKKLKTYEISPVFIGAGNHTQTLAIKGDEQSLEDEPDQDSESEAGNVSSNESKAEKPKSETETNSNESGVDPVDFKFYLDILLMKG